MSSQIINISGKLYDFLIYCNSSNKNIEPVCFNDELLKILKDGMFIVSEKFDEISYLKYMHNKDKYNDSYLSVVMLPTLRCNLNCHYCYEQNKNLSLTNDNFNTLKLFFSKQSEQRKYITIRWSGGEILTEWNRIRELSKHIIQSCKKNNCEYVASAITNGTLLTEEILEEMCQCNIYSLQITLDGAKSEHNSVRSFKNGLGTFDKIIKSVETASKRMKVILRLNIDKHNIETIQDLFYSLSVSDIDKSKLQLFCKPVLCTSVRTPKTALFSQSDFFEVEKQLMLLSEKYRIPFAFHWGMKGYYVRCAYNCLQGFYVTPDLKVYKCPVFIDDLSSDNSIGHITSEGDLLIDNYEMYMKGLDYSPFENEECLKCKILPICHGKCPIIWERDKRACNSGCISEKYNLETKIRYALRNDYEIHTFETSGII